VTDTSGRQYIDGSGGPAVFSMGYAHPEVNAAIEAQLGRAAHGYRYTFTSEPLQRLTALIRKLAGPGSENMVFVSSGSEAMDSALKIALQYHWARGEASRNRFIARERSYHGNTIGALSVSGFGQRRKQFEGGLLDATFVSAANAYRPPDGIAETGLVDFLGAQLEEAIVELGPERVAGFVFEPVVGAAGGVVPSPPGYCHRVREICDRYGILMIADEVMCGSGRCGTWRAMEFDGVAADIMTIAKGLSGGFIPLGATVYSGRIGDRIDESCGGPNTGHTLTGHTLACAAAVCIQEIMIRDKLLERIAGRGARFIDELGERLGDLEAVGDIRGRGYFIGIELVSDRASRRPFDPELALSDRIRKRALENGLVCYPVSGTIDGVGGDVAILAPPYIANDAELDEIADKFEMSLRQVLDETAGGIRR
jgi:adenosylmethionine-8-amino-7-oxononanoate aminotransferase